MLDQYISNDLTIFGARVAAVIDACLTIWDVLCLVHQKIQTTTVEGPIHESCLLLDRYCLSQHDLEPLVVTVQTCHIVGRLVTCSWADCLSRSKHILQVSHWNHVSTADVVDGDMPRLPGPRKKSGVHTASAQPWFLSSAKDTTHIGRGSTWSWEKPDMFD